MQDQITVFRPFICADARWNPATCGARQGEAVRSRENLPPEHQQVLTPLLPGGQVLSPPDRQLAVSNLKAQAHDLRPPDIKVASNRLFQVLRLYWRRRNPAICCVQRRAMEKDVLRAGGSTPANALPPAASVS